MRRAYIICVALFFFSLEAKIYDCFPFFNELELLEARLSELYDHVDKFVLVESVETHRGNPKPLYYQDNKERFQKFSDKIIHIVLRERLNTPDPWDRERFQRDQIMSGLSECQPEDIVIISDLDEITRASSLPSFIHALQVEKKDVVTASLDWYVGYLNVRSSGNWFGAFITTYGHLSECKISPTNLRFFRTQFPIIEKAGWHFSWMGGKDRIAYKIESYAHQEHDNPHDRAHFVEDTHRAFNCKFVDFDESYPQYLLENIDHFRKMGWVAEMPPSLSSCPS